VGGGDKTLSNIGGEGEVSCIIFVHRLYLQFLEFWVYVFVFCSHYICLILYMTLFVSSRGILHLATCINYCLIIQENNTALQRHLINVILNKH